MCGRDIQRRVHACLFIACNFVNCLNLFNWPGWFCFVFFSLFAFLSDEISTEHLSLTRSETQ